jgi:signal peptidase II
MRAVFMLTGLRWLWLTVVVLLFDQLSKQWAIDGLVLHESMPLMPSLDLTLAYNSGAAFSFLSSASGWQRWFFVILALAVSLALLFWLWRLTSQQHLQGSALALILGGALGNVWDRLMYGYVVDFIDVYYGAWHWPVFNVADSAITVGAVLLIIDTIRGPGKSMGKNEHD